MALTQVDQGMLGTNAQYTGFKNRIINGAMVIDQRNAGASSAIDGNNVYTLDRFGAQDATDGSFSVQQNAGSVTPPAGFKSYLGVTVTSADTSLAATQVAQIYQYIEGLNTADFGWGAAGASTVTLSFWVRSSLTGTFGGCISNDGNSRSYPFTYTINSASTWEQKSITIAGDTSGTWLTTNAVGLRIYLSLGAGSTYSGTAGAWATALYLSATGATNVMATNGATFYITGVQLEKGATATSFDYRPYGTEVNLCYRYFTKDVVGGLWNITGYVSCPFPVTMRTAPTVTAAGAFGQATPTVGSVTANFVLINASTIGFYASCSAEL